MLVIVPDEAEAGWVERHLHGLVGVETEATARAERGEAFAAWRRFLEALAEERPLVLVFEDLHWADEALLDFVDYLVDWATRGAATRRLHRPSRAPRAAYGSGAAEGSIRPRSS